MEIDELRFIRDRQRQASYNWESELITDSELPITEKQALLVFDYLCGVFNLKDCKLKFSSRRNGACQRASVIRIGPLFMKLSYLCHEFAHLAVWYNIERNDEGGELEPHGVEWLTVYMILLNRTCEISFERLTQSANSHKLRYDINLLERHCKK